LLRITSTFENFAFSDAAVVISAQAEPSITFLNDVNCNGGEVKLTDCLSPPNPLYNFFSMKLYAYSIGYIIAYAEQKCTLIIYNS